MHKVILIQEPYILREHLIYILVNDFKKLEVSAFAYHEFINKVKKEVEVPGDLLILDIDINEDYIKIINSYKYFMKKVIIITSNNKHTNLLQLLLNNLDGVFYTKMSTREFSYAISEVLHSRKYIHPAFSSLILEDYTRRNLITNANNPTDLLTEREWCVLQFLAKGRSNSEIANSLLIAEKTVKNFISSVLKKLYVKNRTEAVIFAVKKGWISL